MLRCMDAYQRVLGIGSGDCLIPDFLKLIHPVAACMQQHSFVEIDHEIFSTVILFPSADSRRAVVNFWRKNVHKYCLTT